MPRQAMLLNDLGNAMLTMPQSRILVVDDDTSIRSFVEMALDSEGYAVATAMNGAQALAVTGEIQPDLILLDMRMPIMDGWTFARAYRDKPGPHAPIVVITAATDAGERAAEIQADGYLGKPFDLDELLGLVLRYTSRDDDEA
jgi:two-component system chemotaxis response regulator CheY